MALAFQYFGIGLRRFHISISVVSAQGYILFIIGLATKNRHLVASDAAAF